MRKAGLPIESISRYVALKQEGEVTIKERLSILQGERKALIAKKEEIEGFISRLDHKISLFKEKID